MNEEDALTTNGIDGKQKMEEINELQHKKKEKKDCSPSRKIDNENTQLIQDRQVFQKRNLLP